MKNNPVPVDPDGLMEFSVVFTDRSLNHMSANFQQVMRDISETLKEVYHAHSVVVVPGGGTYAMEAVARQFTVGKKALVVRNGWFSYRWTQIFEADDISAEHQALKARQTGNQSPAPFEPYPIDDVVQKILEDKPDVVFAPHVETSAGIILPDNYIRSIAMAAHDVGALFVLDCIASGCMWVDMEKLGVDVLISAPQKGWSSSPCAGLVMLSERAESAMAQTQSTSFSIDLAKWHQIMQAYVNGGHAYHATMPTDALRGLRDAMLETKDYGFDKMRNEQIELGEKVRELVKKYGFTSVAGPGYESPTVVVLYTDDPEIQNGKKFARHGMQVAAGVPLKCDEPDDFSTFRFGLFGLDKLHGIDSAVQKIEDVLEKIQAE